MNIMNVMNTVIIKCHYEHYLQWSFSKFKSTFLLQTLLQAIFAQMVQSFALIPINSGAVQQ